MSKESWQFKQSCENFVDGRAEQRLLVRATKYSLRRRLSLFRPFKLMDSRQKEDGCQFLFHASGVCHWESQTRGLGKSKV